MSRTGYDFRCCLLAVLTLWMTVVGMAVSVSHCHAGGEQPHTHGLGWRLQEPCPMHSGDGSVTHSHLILLGFEMPGEHVPGPGMPAGESHWDSAGGVTVGEAGDDFNALLDELQSPVVAEFVTVRVEEFQPPSTPPGDAPPRLSHFASRRLAGVLVS